MRTLAAAQTSVVMHRDVTSFPSLRQDIAVVVGDDVAAGDVVAAARAAGGPLLSRVEVFDVYRGDQIGAGKVSLALHLVFQAPDRTLTDAEADHARGRHRDQSAAESQFAAELAPGLIQTTPWVWTGLMSDTRRVSVSVPITPTASRVPRRLRHSSGAEP